MGKSSGETESGEIADFKEASCDGGLDVKRRARGARDKTSKSEPVVDGVVVAGEVLEIVVERGVCHVRAGDGKISVGPGIMANSDIVLAGDADAGGTSNMNADMPEPAGNR